MKNIFAAIFALLTLPVCAHIRIVAIHETNPRFIEYQKLCFDRFLNEKVEFIVVNNAAEPSLSKAITKTCHKLEIQCLRFHQKWHSPTSDLVKRVVDWEMREQSRGVTPLAVMRELHPDIRKTLVLRHVSENLLQEFSDIVGVIDEDLFLIKPFDLRGALQKSSIICSEGKDEAESVRYISPSLFFLNCGTLPHIAKLDLDFCVMNNRYAGLGSQSYTYLVNHPRVKVAFFPITSLKSLTLKTPARLQQMGYSHLWVREMTQECPNGVLHFNGSFLKCSHAADKLDSFIHSITSKETS